MAGIDINRSTSGIVLTPEQSQEIWAKAIEASAVMKLASKTPLPGAGKKIQTITGDPEPEWVSETGKVKVSRGTFKPKTIQGHGLGVIVPFSNEFKRDLPALYAAIVERLPAAIGRKFDRTVIGTTPPGENFDVLGGAAGVGIAGNTWKGLVAADQAVASAGGLLNGWAISPQARGILLGSVDGQGRPLFINNVQTDGAVPALQGSPTHQNKSLFVAGTPNTIGIAGDWSDAQWGQVDAIELSIADQASITDGEEVINLWERKMFAVRATVELGFITKDTASFVRLTDAVQAA